jgi:hypothetical protein
MAQGTATVRHLEPTRDNTRQGSMCQTMYNECLFRRPKGLNRHWGI